MSDYTLHTGDALEVLPTLAAGSVDAVVTDPPYLLGASSARVSADKPRPWSGDIENAAFWFAEWYRQVWRVLKPHGCFWTFCNWHTVPVVQCAAARAAIRVVSVLVWDKQWVGVGSQRGLRQTYELVVLMGKPEFGIADRSLGDIWQCKWSGHKPTGHPQEKPVELVRRMLRVSGVPAGGWVLDPFAGSGTTLIAATLEGLHGVGIECEAEYVEMARGRLGELVSRPGGERTLFDESTTTKD